MKKQLKKQLTIISSLARDFDINIYLVGGFIRDALLGLHSNDLDFLVFGNAETLAHVFANKVRGAFVVLDEKEKSFRVVKGEISFDFTANRMDTLKKDLNARDFTVNAFAVSLEDFLLELEKEDKIGIFIEKLLIDETGGLSDLKNKMVRVISEEAFIADPLRLLRAFRIAARYQFKIKDSTLDLIRKHKKLIHQSAGERLHEELNKIFSYSNTFEYILLMDSFGVFGEIFVATELMKKHNEYYFHKLGLWGHSIEVLYCFEFLVNNLEKLFNKKETELFNSLKPDIYKLKIACLFHDFGKPDTFSNIDGKIHFIKHDSIGAAKVTRMLKDMKFTKKEIKFISGIALFHMQVGSLAKIENITDKACFRFFKRTENLALPLILFTLSDWLASIRGVNKLDFSQGISFQEFSYKDFLQCMKSMKILLKWYFKKLNENTVELLLNGHDLMNRYDLKPSKFLGEILADLEEAQMTDKVKTKEQAYIFVEHFLENKKNKIQ